MEFKIGDIIKLEGTVTKIDNGSIFPVVVLFKNKKTCMTFTKDGRHYHTDSVPILEFVSRPKKLVKKWRWVYKYEGVLDVTDEYYHDEAEFKKIIGCTRNSCAMKLIEKIDSTEIEVEED